MQWGDFNDISSKFENKHKGKELVEESDDEAEDEDEEDEDEEEEDNE
jgi:hypothetical protein